MANRGHSKEYTKKLIKIIVEDGWQQVRQKGSHRQFKHPTKKGLVTVPYHITKNIEIRILKQAGLRGTKQIINQRKEIKL